MANDGKYLNSQEILNLLGDLQLDPSFKPMSQDTYNETAIIAAINKTKQQDALLMAAINMSCIGYGSKRYGIFKYKEQAVDIAELMLKTGVKIGLAKDAKLTESDLTPQRLCRAFRHNIKQYVEDTHFETYLFRKYSTKDPNFASICFRGAEYLDDLTPEECNYLLQVYTKIDSEKGIDITARIKRVFQAKGYLPRTVN